MVQVKEFKMEMILKIEFPVLFNSVENYPELSAVQCSCSKNITDDEFDKQF